MSEEIDAFLAPYSPEVRELALTARALVLDVFPGAIEQIDAPAKLIGYGFARTYTDLVCVIMPLKAAVNLGFARGALLLDPAGLLAGTGKRARHVKLRSAADVEAPALRALLEAAIAASKRSSA
jgi:hypothetical protein